MRLNHVNPHVEIRTKKAGKREPSRVWIVLKKCFFKFEKSPWEHHILKKKLFLK
jgi:hypothetical protein